MDTSISKVGDYMDAILLIGKNCDKLIIDYTKYYVIAVDSGVDYAIKNNIKIDLAIGDFDSAKADLKDSNLKKIVLNPIKDDTDTAAAFNYTKDFDNVIIVGGIQGKRIEHFLANIMLIKNHKNIIMIDNSSKIFYVPNEMKISKNSYKFISFFALENVENLCLDGFKYNLNNYNLNTLDPLCISNEITKDQAIISYDRGVLIAIMSNDDN